MPEDRIPGDGGLAVTAALSRVDPVPSIKGVPVSLRGVSKEYTGATTTVALDTLDLVASAGEFLTLLGPSGSGKTTALQIIAGLTEQSSGEVWLGDREVGRLDPSRRDIGVVFQNYALFPHMTVAANVGYPLRIRKTDRTEQARRVAAALATVELEHLAERKPAQLSGGQQQRVAIARALVFQPRLLLMDEPLGALDKRLRDQMQRELRELQQRVGITCIYVTHDQEEAMFLSDRIAILDNGRLQQVGTAEDIYRRPANEFVADFVGRMNLWDAEVITDDLDGSVVRIGEQFTLRSVQRFDVGTRVRVATRPESVRVTTTSGETVAHLHAVRFNGASSFAQLTVEAVEVMAELGHRAVGIPAGEVRIAIAPEDVRLFPTRRNEIT